MSANEPVLPILFGDSDIDALNAAWEQKTTFAYAAKRSGVSEDWIKAQLKSLPTDFHEDRFILFTSGSTGEPKLIIGNKKRSEQLTQILHQVQESEPVEETVVMLPLTYTFAFVNQWLWAKTHLKKITLTTGLSDPKALAETLKKSKKSMLCMVGAI